MPGKLLRPKHIDKGMLLSMPDALFLFGDNMNRTGNKGQAAVMRGHSNALGVPTKWWPCRRPNCYFTDSDLQKPEVRYAIRMPFIKAGTKLMEGGTVVVPLAGFGNGLSQLSHRAPAILEFINHQIAELHQLEDYPARAAGSSSPAYSHG